MSDLPAAERIRTLLLRGDNLFKNRRSRIREIVEHRLESLS